MNHPNQFFSKPSERPASPLQAPQSTRGRKMTQGLRRKATLGGLDSAAGSFTNSQMASPSSPRNHVSKNSSVTRVRTSTPIHSRGIKDSTGVTSNKTDSPSASSGHIDQLLREFRKELDSIKSMDVVQHHGRSQLNNNATSDDRGPVGTSQAASRFTSNNNTEDNSAQNSSHPRLHASPIASVKSSRQFSLDSPLQFSSRRRTADTSQNNGTVALRDASDDESIPNAYAAMEHDDQTPSSPHNQSGNAPSFLPLSERSFTHSPAAGLSSLIRPSDTQEDILRRKQVNRILGMPDQTPLRTPNFKIFSQAGSNDISASNEDMSRLLSSIQKSASRSHIDAALPAPNSSNSKRHHSLTHSDGTPSRERSSSSRFSSIKRKSMPNDSSAAHKFHSLLNSSSHHKENAHSPSHLLSRSTQKKFNELKSRDRLNVVAPREGESNSDALRIENMQLRSEVSRLSSQVVGLESRVDGLQKNLETLIHLLFDQQQ